MTRSISTARKFSVLSANLSILSVILGIVCFGLPYWIYFDDVIIVSISGTTNNVRMKFHYGFWSFCNDVSTSTQTLSNCGPIKTHSDQEQLTICLVMLSIILSVNAFINTCLFLLLMKNEKMCLYVTAASALLSGLLSAAADINYGIQDHTAKISASYTLPFSLSNLSVAFWLSIVNCIIISLSAVFTVVALYFHDNKDIRDVLSTGSPRESIYQYEKEVPKDTIYADSQDIYEQTPYKSPGYGVFEEDSSDDEDSKRPLCIDRQNRKGILLSDEGSLGQSRRMEQPSLEIDDYTKHAKEYVSGVWSELEKHNTVYESSDNESLTLAIDDENAPQQSHGTRNSNSDGSVVKAVPAGSRSGSLNDNVVRMASSVSGLINRSLSTDSANSRGGRTFSNFEDNTEISFVNGNYEVFMLPQDQPKTKYAENAKGYFILDNDIKTFEPSSSRGAALSMNSRQGTAENIKPNRMVNTSYTTLSRPESKTSSIDTISSQKTSYIDQKSSKVSPNATRTLTPVSIDATRMQKYKEEISLELPTIPNELDSLACSRPSLRDYPDAFSLISQPGHPPLDTRIQSDTNEVRTKVSDEQIVTIKDRVSLGGSFESYPEYESIRENIQSLNNPTNNPVCLNGNAKQVAMANTLHKAIEIDIASAISNKVNETLEHTENMINVNQAGEIVDISKVTKSKDRAQKSNKRKKISIQFNVAPPVLLEETSTRTKVKTVRKMPFGRDRKQNSTTMKQQSAPRRPPTAKSLRKQHSLTLDENNPYSRPGTAVKLEESRPFKESNEVKIMSKKELVKKAAYKRLKQSYQCKLPRMYNTEKQEIFRKLAKIHTESTVKNQDPSKVAGTKSSDIRPSTSKRHLSPSTQRTTLKLKEQNKSEAEAWSVEDGVHVSKA